MSARYLALMALLVGVVLAWPVQAQSGGGYDLTWSTIDGGGGESSGGAYSLGGTLGQPDAGAMRGGGAVSGRARATSHLFAARAAEPLMYAERKSNRCIGTMFVVAASAAYGGDKSPTTNGACTESISDQYIIARRMMRRT